MSFFDDLFKDIGDAVNNVVPPPTPSPPPSKIPGLVQQVTPMIAQGTAALVNPAFTSHLRQSMARWFEEDREIIESCVNAVQQTSRTALFRNMAGNLESAAQGGHLNNQVKQNVTQLKNSQVLANANTRAQDVGGYRSWSLQWGGEASVFFGGAWALGYATLIFESSRSDQVKGVFSAGHTIASMGGAVDQYWGWWVDEPSKLAGTSFSFGFDMRLIFGGGVVMVSDFRGNKLGFIINTGLGLEGGGDLQFSGTAVFG